MCHAGSCAAGSRLRDQVQDTTPDGRLKWWEQAIALLLAPLFMFITLVRLICCAAAKQPRCAVGRRG